MKLFIHLGYPKTASTFLNSNFFSKHNQVNLITENEEAGSFIQSIKYLDEDKYEKEKLKIISFFESKILEKKINIFSDEMFLVPLGYKLYDNKNAIKRLHEIFLSIQKIKDIKFLLMIRKPEELFLSYYTDEYHRIIFHDKNLDKFENFLNLETIKNNFFLKRVIKTFDYKDIFTYFLSFNKDKTKKNIGIFLLEELKNDIDIFSQKISSFLEINQSETIFLIKNKIAENVTTKNKNFYYKRYDWNVFFSKYNFFYKILPIKLIRYIKKNIFLNYIWFFKSKIIVQLSTEQKELIKSLYLKNLNEIEKNFHLELKKNNYYN